MKRYILIVCSLTLLAIILSCSEGAPAVEELTNKQKFLMSRLGDEKLDLTSEYFDLMNGDGDLDNDGEQDIGAGVNAYVDWDGDLNEDGTYDVIVPPLIDGDNDWNNDGDPDFGTGSWVDFDGDVNEDSYQDLHGDWLRSKVDYDGDLNEDDIVDLLPMPVRDPLDPYQNVQLTSVATFRNGEWNGGSYDNDKTFDITRLFGNELPPLADGPVDMVSKIQMSIFYFDDGAAAASASKGNAKASPSQQLVMLPTDPDSAPDSLSFPYGGTDAKWHVYMSGKVGSDDNIWTFYESDGSNLLLKADLTNWDDTDTSSWAGYHRFDLKFFDIDNGVKSSTHLPRAPGGFYMNWNKGDNDPPHYDRISIRLDYWPDGVGVMDGPNKGLFRYMIKGVLHDPEGDDGGLAFGGNIPMEIVGRGVYQNFNGQGYWLEYIGDMDENRAR